MNYTFDSTLKVGDYVGVNLYKNRDFLCKLINIQNRNKNNPLVTIEFILDLSRPNEKLSGTKKLDGSWIFRIDEKYLKDIYIKKLENQIDQINQLAERIKNDSL